MWGWMWPRLSIFSPWSSPSCRIAVGICKIDFSRPQLTFLIGISFATKKKVKASLFTAKIIWFFAANVRHQSATLLWLQFSIPFRYTTPKSSRFPLKEAPTSFNKSFALSLEIHLKQVTFSLKRCCVVLFRPFNSFQDLPLNFSSFFVTKKKI